MKVLSVEFIHLNYSLTKPIITTDTETPFLDTHLSIANGFVSSKIYAKSNDFDIVTFPFMDGDIPRRASFRNLLGSLESVIKLQTSVRGINV